MTCVLGCFASLLLAAVQAPSDAPASRDIIAPADNTALTPLAELRPMEVRMRKLFLVRPDLMRYPLPYDTLC